MFNKKINVSKNQTFLFCEIKKISKKKKKNYQKSD